MIAKANKALHLPGGQDRGLKNISRQGVHVTSDYDEAGDTLKASAPTVAAVSPALRPTPGGHAVGPEGDLLALKETLPWRASLWGSQNRFNTSGQASAMRLAPQEQEGPLRSLSVPPPAFLVSLLCVSCWHSFSLRPKGASAPPLPIIAL